MNASIFSGEATSQEVTMLVAAPCAESSANLPPGVDSNNRARKIAWLHERHWTMLIISTCVLIAAPLLSLTPSGHVTASWAPIDELPPMCGSRALFGVECPGCGLTRSFVALARGDVAASLGYNRVGWLLALATMLQVPYRVFALRELKTGLPERKWPTYIGNLLIAALIVNWLLKMI